MSLSNDPKTLVKIITGLYILKILRNGSAHGNKIAEEIRRRTQNSTTANPNGLYPLLRIMEDRGYIRGEWSNPDTRGKRIYTITESGIANISTLEAKVVERLNELEQKISILRKDLLGNEEEQ